MHAIVDIIMDVYKILYRFSNWLESLFLRYQDRCWLLGQRYSYWQMWSNVSEWVFTIEPAGWRGSTCHHGDHAPSCERFYILCSVQCMQHNVDSI